MEEDSNCRVKAVLDEHWIDISLGLLVKLGG